MDEHESPGAVPARRHGLRAEEQSVVLLGVALPARSEDGEPGIRRDVGG